MRYIAPIPVNSTLVLQGRVTYAGNTSLEVCVDGFIEEFDGSRSLVMSCAMLFVGVDKAGRPVKVPGLLLDEAEAARDGLPAQRRAPGARPAPPGGFLGALMENLLKQAGFKPLGSQDRPLYQKYFNGPVLDLCFSALTAYWTAIFYKEYSGCLCLIMREEGRYFALAPHGTGERARGRGQIMRIILPRGAQSAL